MLSGKAIASYLQISTLVIAVFAFAFLMRSAKSFILSLVSTILFSTSENEPFIFIVSPICKLSGDQVGTACSNWPAFFPVFAAYEEDIGAG